MPSSAVVFVPPGLSNTSPKFSEQLAAQSHLPLLSYKVPLAPCEVEEPPVPPASPLVEPEEPPGSVGDEEASAQPEDGDGVAAPARPRSNSGLPKYAPGQDRIDN